MMRTLYMLLLCTLVPFSDVVAQELNTTVVVNHAQASAVSADVAQSLRRDVSAYLNQTMWSNTPHAPHERVKCSFTLVLKPTSTTNQFDVELLVSAMRPVYNSIYLSPLLVWREPSFRFDYNPYQPLTFSPNPTQLSATLAYYVYMILGLDADSMAERGGDPHYQQALQIATTMQATGDSGWESVGNNRSRMALVQSLVDGSADDYRAMWYAYHRQALDTMAADKRHAVENIITQITHLEAYRQRFPRSVLPTLFGDTKLSEVVGLVQSSSSEVRRPLYDLLNKLYPTKTSQFDSLNRP